MERQKCENCSAPMVLLHNRDGTDSYKCEYCGTLINIRPKTTSDKIFTFVNRAINAIKDDGEPVVSAEKQAEFDQHIAAINKKKQQAYEKYIEKRLKAYEKYVDKRSRK